MIKEEEETLEEEDLRVHIAQAAFTEARSTPAAMWSRIRVNTWITQIHVD